MISKIRSEKLSVLNHLLVATVCLTLLFGCNQKKLTKSPVSEVKAEQSDEKVYREVDQMPEFPGGALALRKFVAATVKYPLQAAKGGIQGKVFVSFVVGKDGKVKNAKIARGVDPLLDAEALRVVNGLPKWHPGKNKGTIVSVGYTIPINFALK